MCVLGDTYGLIYFGQHSYRFPLFDRVTVMCNKFAGTIKGAPWNQPNGCPSVHPANNQPSKCVHKSPLNFNTCDAFILWLFFAAIKSTHSKLECATQRFKTHMTHRKSPPLGCSVQAMLPVSLGARTNAITLNIPRFYRSFLLSRYILIERGWFN